MPTLQNLKKHAKRFGSDGVMEAAVESGLPFEELVELQKHIDALHAEDKWAKKPRLTAETRVKRMLGIEEAE
jgi:hypothetical protein